MSATTFRSTTTFRPDETDESTSRMFAFAEPEMDHPVVMVEHEWGGQRQKWVIHEIHQRTDVVALRDALTRWLNLTDQ